MSKFRWSALAVMALPAASVFAENYVVQIFGVPENGHAFEAVGAGDNALIAGTLKTTDGRVRAAYQTLTGYKILHPAGWSESWISDSVGSTYHAGYGSNSLAQVHALFWVGGGAGIDLHPAGPYSASQAFGVGGQLQVGFARMTSPCPECGQSSSFYHAGVWSRTAASFRRLHAPGHHDTDASGTDGTRAAGEGTNNSTSKLNALYWSSITANAVNLHPSGFDESWCRGVDGNLQAGTVSVGGKMRAALWKGSAGTFVNLHPSATFDQTFLNGIRGTLQVGAGRPIGNTGRVQAIAWHGNAATWINLHARLPYPYNLYWGSTASDVDNQGNIIGSIRHLVTGEQRAVVWRRTN